MGINQPQQQASPLDRMVQLLQGVNAGKDIYDKFKASSKASDQEAVYSDPNSEDSRRARDLVSKIGGSPIAETVSRKQIETEYGPIAQLASGNLKSTLDHRNAMELARLKGEQDRRTEGAKLSQKAPTGEQFKVAGYGKRLEQSEKVFTDLAAKGYNRADIQEGAISGLGNAPLIGGLVRPFQSEQLKMQQQAEDNFLNAVLRRESGAAIADSERESGSRQYFPRPGDSPEVLAQKAENRRLVADTFRAEGGQAGDRIVAQAGRPSAIPVNVKSPGNGMINEAQAGQSQNTRVINGVVYVDDGQGWKRL